jgi:hypothetical protein
MVLCALISIGAVLLSLVLQTSQIYTHLFYIPIAWVAVRLPKYSLVTGIGYGSLHLLLEWARGGAASPYSWARAITMMLVAVVLQQIWKREKQIASRLQEMDFQRFMAHDSGS